MGMGIPIRTVSKGEEYLEIVKHPRHGRGIGDEPVHRLPDLHPAQGEGVHGGDRGLLPGHRGGRRAAADVPAGRRVARHREAQRMRGDHPAPALRAPPPPHRCRSGKAGWTGRSCSRSRAAPARSRSGSRRSSEIGDYPCPGGGMHADRPDLLPQGAGSPRPSPFLRDARSPPPEGGPSFPRSGDEGDRGQERGGEPPARGPLPREGHRLRRRTATRALPWRSWGEARRNASTCSPGSSPGTARRDRSARTRSARSPPTGSGS